MAAKSGTSLLLQSLWRHGQWRALPVEWPALWWAFQLHLPIRCEEQSPKSVFLQHKTKSLVRVKNIGTYSFKIEIAISCTPCKISTSVYLCFCTKHRSEPKVSVSFTDAFIFMLFICRLVSLKSPVTRHLSDGGWRMEDSISSDTETKIVKSSDIRSKFFFYSHILEWTKLKSYIIIPASVVTLEKCEIAFL